MNKPAGFARLGGFVVLAGLAIATLASMVDRAGLAPLPPAPGVGATRYRAAALALTRHGDVAGARRAALVAARLAPLDRSALSLLGVLAARAGDPATSAAAFVAAARLGWRDPVTQLWAFDQALAQTQFDVAADRAEGLIRSDPQDPNIPAVLDALASRPETQRRLARRLAGNAGWTTAALADLEKLRPAELERRISTLRQASTLGYAPSVDIRSQAVNRIGSLDLYSAWLVWQVFALPDAQRGTFARGGFETRDTSTPFDWQTGSGGTLIAQPTSDRRVRITGSNAVRQTLLWRLVHLGPGTYQLAWRSSSQNGDPDIAAEGDCAEPAAPLPSGEVMRRGERGHFVRTLKIPAACLVVYLKLTALPGGGDGRTRWTGAPELSASGS